jgi:hypothetical protein
MFLNPGLEELVLEVGAKLPRLSAFLADMTSRIRLRTFSFTSPTSLPGNFTELLANQGALEKVTLVAPGALGPDVGRWTASLPALHCLQLDLTGRAPIAVEGFFDDIGPQSGDSTPSSVATVDSGVFSGDELDFSEIRKSTLRLTGDFHSKGSFRRLRQVHLTGEAANICVFLKHITSPLIRLDLVIEDPPDRADWQDLSSLLSERFGASLQSLRITATNSSRYSELVRSTSRAEAPYHPLPLDHFAPCPQLTRFEIDLPESVIFRESDIRRLGEMCPHLEVLKLCPVARFPSSPPSLTLADLAPLLTGCPRLNTLAVVINAEEGNEEVISSPSVTSRSLLRLHVGHSWVRDPLHVAILLSHLAPQLEILKWFNERNRPGFVEANSRGWESVSTSLPHLQKVRSVERKHALAAVSHPVHVPPQTSDKIIDATITSVDRAVHASSYMREIGTQITPSLVSQTVQAKPKMSSIAIDARPTKVDANVDASIPTSHQNIDARPKLITTGVEATISTSTKSVEAKPMHNHARFYVISSLLSMLSFLYRLFITYPLCVPVRVWHAAVNSQKALLTRPPVIDATDVGVEEEKEPASAVKTDSPTSSKSSDSDYIISPVRA